MAKTSEEMMRAEALKSRLPTLPNERPLAWFDVLLIQISFSVATWMLITGAYIGMATPLYLAIIAGIFGCSLPLFFHCFIGKACARWGLDHAILTKAAAGPIGTLILTIGISIFTYLCWTSIPVVMFGRATHEVFSWLGVTGGIASPVLWSFIVLGVASYILWRHTATLKYFFRIVTPLILALLALLTYRMVAEYGWVYIASIRPEGFHPDPFISFMIAVEIAVGLGFSWIFCFAIYCRQAKSEGGAFYGTWLGWGVVWAICMIPAIMAALVAGVTDPVYVLKEIGGGWVLLYMCFLVLANIFSAICTMYIVSLTARTLWPRLRWIHAVAINWFVILLILMPAVYDLFGSFIAFIGAWCGPAGVILVVDLLLRRFNVNMLELYDETKKSAYYYWKGVNWLVFLCAGAGTSISLLIYNPLTAVPHIEGVFRVAGAAIPGSVAAGILYYILARVFLVPRKIGFPPIPKPAAEDVSKNA